MATERIDHPLLRALGRILSPRIHVRISRRTRWMFAAVWIVGERRHVWMWVEQKAYYQGGQSIPAR